jgi:MoaA/NifB/PqqE/SkfB family radical SAM enzyme
MSLSLYKYLAKQWAEDGYKHMDLTPTLGEPLLDENLFEKIAYAKHLGLRVVITTNGTLLHKRGNCSKLVQSGIDEIYISTEGASRDDYIAAYGVDAYEDTMRGIGELLLFAQDSSCTIGIRFRSISKPSDTLLSPEYRRHIARYAWRARIHFTVDYDDWGGLVRTLPGSMRFRKEWHQSDAPCVGLFGFWVTYDGMVNLCGCRFDQSHPEMELGDAKTEKLSELVQSEKRWRIVRQFIEGDRPTCCQGCKLYNPIDKSTLNTI